VAAALYAFSPYLRTDLYVRADLAETLGFATFPLALWALDAALDRRPPGAPRAWGRVAALALALAALGTSHNATALFSTYYLGAWLIARLAMRTIDRASVVRAIAGGGLGFLITVFFTVPAAADRRLVWIEKIATGFYHFSRNFAPLPGLFWSWARWDMRLNFGVAATVAMALAVVALARLSRRSPHVAAAVPARGLAILALTGSLLTVVLATRPLGIAIYTVVPLAHFVQFPWRMLLFGAGFAALAGAVALDVLAPARLRTAIAIAVVALLAITSWPDNGPRGPLHRRYLDPQKFLRSLPVDYVTSVEEYLPRTVIDKAPRGNDVARAEGSQATLKALERGPGWYRIALDTTKPVVVHVNLHWFPGWRATVDGERVAIGPQGAARLERDGLVRVPVPAGTHTVELRYGRTPLRWGCDLLSLLALLATLGMLVRAARDRWRERRRGRVDG